MKWFRTTSNCFAVLWEFYACFQECSSIRPFLFVFFVNVLIRKKKWVKIVDTWDLRQVRMPRPPLSANTVSDFRRGRNWDSMDIQTQTCTLTDITSDNATHSCSLTNLRNGGTLWVANVVCSDMSYSDDHSWSKSHSASLGFLLN